MALELEGRGAAKRQGQPTQLGLSRGGLRVEPRRFGVEQVGHDQHCLRMLLQAVGHLLKADAHVLVAYLLTNGQQRHAGETVVQQPHDACEHSAVAHACVKDPQGVRFGLQVLDLHADAVRYDLFFVAGVHEEEVLLPVVEEAEGVVLFRGSGHSGACWYGGLYAMAPSVHRSVVRVQYRRRSAMPVPSCEGARCSGSA